MKKLLLILLCVPLIGFGQDAKSFNKGYEYYTTEKYELSIDYFTKYIIDNPNNSSLYIVRGASYKSLDLYKLAIEDYEEAIEIDDNILGYNNRAWIYITLKNYELAMQDYKVVVSRIEEMRQLGMTNLGDIYCNLGICKMNLGLDYCEDFNIACILGYKPACEIDCE
jgi:tetratricopeptide (TPR) repeat protein